MPQAKVESIDALKSLKVAMLKFGESATLALGDAESDINRTLHWLEIEQSSYWTMQHRKRTELVGRCKEAVRMKKLFKDSSGRQQSAIEEEKALKVAVRKLEESEFKITAVRKAIAKLNREIQLYRGSVQRFATDVLVDVPAAAAHLENLLVALHAYAGLNAPTEATSHALPATSPTMAGTDVPSTMARSVDSKCTEDADDNDEKPLNADAGQV